MLNKNSEKIKQKKRRRFREWEWNFPGDGFIISKHDQERTVFFFEKIKRLKKEEDHMKVTTEDLYSWIDEMFQKLETPEKGSISKVCKGCGYVISY